MRISPPGKRSLKQRIVDEVIKFSDRAFEDVAHAQLATDLLYVDRLALVGEGAVARDHEQPMDAVARGLRQQFWIAARRWTMRAIEAGLLSVDCLKASQTSVHAA